MECFVCPHCHGINPLGNEAVPVLVGKRDCDECGERFTVNIGVSAHYL